ncbi:NAD(P)/FAD-dependent oxidoreductase [Alcaligenaceae bacterium LF4-65]|uniref:NAD(P)/FAD-dependent oxidoreductase n=1 Tax=Zwartia hollandica TaxID=324606 RepID=A0A953NB55_9BURK|nr:NAD(P)/FAD-dependent oxidoreductase [Zwartia hollandica]MBZ1351113.1 NAD(P)/FAD-dependent oxidoreductase [Zwartia hollandica]
MLGIASQSTDNPFDTVDRISATNWLNTLNSALAKSDEGLIKTLFADDCHWRDLLAFTWSLTPTAGGANIASLMLSKQAQVKARDFKLAEGRLGPRRLKRTGIDVIESVIQFETELGRCFGVLRLLQDHPEEAFQLLTSMHELKGHEEKIGGRRPTGAAYSRNFGGTNWQDQRIASQAYADREPTVLVVGGGQAGLSVAASLVLIGVDTLVIDKYPNIGDSWRKRYHSLALHNVTDLNHLPYLPFPESWPSYLPKDMVGNWLEIYAQTMEINNWTSTELATATYNEETASWTAVLKNNVTGTERTVRPKHIIFANGLVGLPRIPKLPGLEDFTGEVMHTSSFTSGAKWKGKRALVLGTGTSAHDVAQDLHSNGVETTMIQRGSTTVVSIDPSLKLTYALYEGIALEDGDLLSSVNTLEVTKRNFKQTSARMIELDKKLINDLIACGFKWDNGENDTGYQMKIRTRYGGYYLNAGCSDLIISGAIGLCQYEQIDTFVENGALLKDGTIKQADLIVMATGFVPQEEVVKQLLGEEVAQKIGPVWGLAPDGEMNNMWRRTSQKGLWFVGGSFTNCRIYSRYVAIQIKALEEGLLH